MGITNDDFPANGSDNLNGFINKNLNFWNTRYYFDGDYLTEGDEILNFKLFSDSSRTKQVGQTATVTIKDTYPQPYDHINWWTAGEGNNTNFGTRIGNTNQWIDGEDGEDSVVFNGDYKDYRFTRVNEILKDFWGFDKYSTDLLVVADQREGPNNGINTLKNIDYLSFKYSSGYNYFYYDIPISNINIVKKYSGNFRDYKFYQKLGDKYEIKNDLGIIDNITGIPTIEFADQTINGFIDIKSTFDQVRGLNTDSGKMFRLYNAAFARFPDADGLNYWISKYTSGENDDRAVAQSFLVSNEFSERYGDNITHETYVQNLYLNVLNRELDQGGYDYWVGNLNNGVEQRHEVLLGFSESAENKTLFTDMTGFG